MTAPRHGPRDPGAARRFRRNLISVLGVEVITLVLLWMLQRTYTP